MRVVLGLSVAPLVRSLDVRRAVGGERPTAGKGGQRRWPCSSGGEGEGYWVPPAFMSGTAGRGKAHRGQDRGGLVMPHRSESEACSMRASTRKGVYPTARTKGCGPIIASRAVWMCTCGGVDGQCPGAVWLVGVGEGLLLLVLTDRHVRVQARAQQHQRDAHLPRHAEDS